MGQNRLKIQAESLDLELTGDADYVRDAYQAIRSVVMQRFERTLRAQGEEKVPERASTQPLYRIEEVRENLAANQQLSGHPIRLVVCNQLYHKVAVLSREDMEKSILGKHINSMAIEHIYINEEDAPALTGHIEIGKTLWRELTPHGRTIIHGKPR